MMKSGKFVYEANFCIELVEIIKKLMPGKFSFRELPLTEENIPKVIEQVFGKGINEQQQCHVYAQFCVKIINKIPQERNRRNIKSCIVNMAQKRFEGVLAGVYSEKISMGIVKFLGELSNAGILTPRIIKNCFYRFLKTHSPPTSFYLGCLCSLLSVVGLQLEKNNSDILDMAMTGIEDVVENHRSEIDKPTRKLIAEVFKLRANKWRKENIGNVAEDTNQQNINKEIANFSFQVQKILKTLNVENSYDFIVGFKRMKLSYETLKESVKLIFQHGCFGDSYFFAFISKSISSTSAKSLDGLSEVTFKTEMMRIFHSELDFLANQSEELALAYNQLGQFKSNIREMKTQESLKDFEQILIRSTQLYSAFNFLGELFNNDFIDTVEVLKILRILGSIEFLSDILVECFCVLFNAITPKILSDGAFSENLAFIFGKMYERTLKAQMLPRTHFTLKNVYGRAQFLFNYHIGNEDFEIKIDNLARFESPWRPKLSTEKLWN